MVKKYPKTKKTVKKTYRIDVKSEISEILSQYNLNQHNMDQEHFDFDDHLSEKINQIMITCMNEHVE